MINLRKVTIYFLTSCNTEERIAQNICIRSSNKIYKRIKLSVYNFNSNNNTNLEMNMP